jgi:hypothetical protein
VSELAERTCATDAEAGRKRGLDVSEASSADRYVVRCRWRRPSAVGAQSPPSRLSAVQPSAEAMEAITTKSTRARKSSMSASPFGPCVATRIGVAARSHAGMRDTERCAHARLRSSRFAARAVLLRVRHDDDPQHPLALTERSQPSEAAFHSPATTVPLRTTVTGSLFRACYSSASPLSSLRRVLNPDGRSIKRT